MSTSLLSSVPFPLVSSGSRSRSGFSIFLVVVAAFVSVGVTPSWLSAAPDQSRYVSSVQSQVLGEIEKLGESGGIWGVYAEEVGSKRPIVEIQGETLLLPASNRKLFSTALALRRLGANYQFRTQLWAIGNLGSDGVLDGDLILEVSGDPTLRPTFLRGGSGLGLLSRWAKEVETAGIRRVTGSVIVDCSVYQEPSPMPPGWAWDQMTELYGALPSAVALNENRVLLKITPGSREGADCDVETIPTFKDGFGIERHCVTAAASEKNTLRVVRATGVSILQLVGEVPAGQKTVSLTVPLADPVTAWASQWGEYLEKSGVSFPGSVVVSRERRVPGGTDSKKRLLVQHESPPLGEIVQWTNRESDNQCAEMIYLAVGREVMGQGSYESSRMAELNFLREIGIPDRWVTGEDGSGLGRTDLVAPRGMVSLLRAMDSSPEREVFLESLPVSGKSGTLEYRMSKDGMKGRVMAKTGTLRDVCAL